jgi:uncharacterized lipoprotein YbaY
MVTGEVLLDEPVSGSATVRVTVEDVTRADALARAAGEVTIALAPSARGPVPFAVEVAAVDPRASYALRVHVDLDGDGEVSAGDLVSTQSHPVLTRGAPAHVRVKVTPI